MYSTYIIASLTNGKWYNNGWNWSTKSRGPWKYIFVRPFPTAEQAREFEFHLKKLRRKAYILKKYNEYFLKDAGTTARLAPGA